MTGVANLEDELVLYRDFEEESSTWGATTPGRVTTS